MNPALTKARSYPALLAAVAIAAIGAASGVSGASPPALPTLPPPAPPAAGKHLLFGPIAPPRPLPSVPLTMDGGERSDLLAQTRGAWTLTQLIFTRCETVCPLQGAIFQQAQAKLVRLQPGIKLLSLSIDPEADSPLALQKWREAFDAGPAWRAAVAGREDVAKLLDILGARKSGLDIHEARVYFIDPEGRLAYATEELPNPEALASLLEQAIARDAKK